MVTTKLMQQFANQLYQISCCIAHAKRMNTGYLIPTKTITGHPTHQYKNVKYGDIDLPIYKDDERKYTPIPMRDNICLQGYFQDYNYFMEYWDDVQEALALDWSMNEGRISIHVRRGDYLKHPKWFPQLSDKYFGDSINYFRDLGYKDFVVYSDDIYWCRENITKEIFGVNVGYSEGKTAIEDLISMSECEGNIIANSTFSVWAAYLNKNPNKIVIRPSFFLGERGKHLHKNVYLPNWIIKNN